MTVERLIHSLEVLLTGIAERPDRTVGELPLLTGEDHRFLLQTATAAVEPAGTVPGLFDAQAARQPGAAAVTCGEVRLTYRELRDGTGPSRVGFSAHWRSDNDNPALANFLKLFGGALSAAGAIAGAAGPLARLV